VWSCGKEVRFGHSRSVLTFVRKNFLAFLKKGTTGHCRALFYHESRV